jgi:hypothetical protein
MPLPEYFEAIENHIDSFFDESDEIAVFDEKDSPDFHLDVYWIKANTKREYNILLTNGISSLPMNTPNTNFSPYIELALLLPKSWELDDDKWKKDTNYWPRMLLKQFGRYPHDNNTWLGFGHTILQPSGKSIIGTEYKSTILLKSKTLPIEFQKIKYKQGYIEIYILFPLFESEQVFKEKNGTNELLNLFQEKGIDDIVDLQRKKCI